MIFSNSITADDILPPYSRMISPEILRLDNGKLMATVKIKGITFETESGRVLHNKFLIEQRLFNALCRKYGDKLAIWTHIVKSKEHFQSVISLITLLFKHLSINIVQALISHTFILRITISLSSIRHLMLMKGRKN
ncbi:hypothetical protein ACN08S_08905 (plasmid) [Photobacterium leiognathi subsp. mandapamensis]|uniref:hypothetical protein n=1 Tax=Photobacterium leiognathi TaxID=553611 RepID=UPI003AF3577C